MRIFNFPTNAIYESRAEAKKHYATQRREFENFAKLILDYVPNDAGNLLDVGCGFGWVVCEANKRGFVAQGIDQSKAYTELGKKMLKVDLKYVSLEKFKSRIKFDIVILNHVLEHIEKPNVFLGKIRSLISPKGQLFVAVPNIDSLMFKLFQSRWYGLQPHQHIWQFTPLTLKKLLEENGLSIVKMETRNLGYQVKGLKGLAFKLIMFVAPKIGQGDQVFILAKLK